MTSQTSLTDRLAAFAAAVIPVWVYDHDRLRFVWANPEALQLWRAVSVEEFQARDLSTSSASTLTRLSSYMGQIRDGRAVSEDWTLYPRGVPATMTLHGSGIALDDGRLAILFQALPKQRELDESLVRGVEALRHTSLLVSLVGDGGAVLFQNPAALRAFGDSTDAGAWFVRSEVAAALLAAQAEQQPLAIETEVHTLSGPRWHLVEAQPTVDPVTGARSLLVQQRDISARRRAEDHAASQERLVAELRQALALVEAQRRQIVSLSAPLIPLGPDTLALPLVGALDEDGAHEITVRVLETVVKTRARFVLIDLTGLDDQRGPGGGPSLEEIGATRLRRLVHAIQLLGASPVLTGISPQMAQTITAAGIELSDEAVLRTLYDGLQYCLSRSQARPRREK